MLAGTGRTTFNMNKLLRFVRLPLQTAAPGCVSPAIVLTVAHISTKPRNLLMSIFSEVLARTKRPFSRTVTNSSALTWMLEFTGTRRRRSSHGCMITVLESVATTFPKPAHLQLHRNTRFSDGQSDWQIRREKVGEEMAVNPLFWPQRALLDL